VCEGVGTPRFPHEGGLQPTQKRKSPYLLANFVLRGREGCRTKKDHLMAGEEKGKERRGGKKFEESKSSMYYETSTRKGRPSASSPPTKRINNSEGTMVPTGSRKGA